MVLLLSLLGCGEQQKIERASGGARLAVLSPALADTLHRLGHGDLIVGRQQFDRFTDPGVPVVGDLTGIDYETMILANPTHIVAQETASGLPARLLELASNRGWEIIELPLLTLNDVVSSIAALDELAGSERSGDAAELVEAFGSLIDADLDLGRTVIVASARPLSVIGPGAFHWELIERLGGEPVPESGSAYITLDAESLAALSPRTIVVLAPGASEDAGLDELLGAADGLAMPALELGRVIVVTDERCMLPSTSLLGVIERIRARAGNLGGPADP